ncbi:MAG: hypothetical protein ACOYO9_13025 [Candidatus Nanopelagicales bacterium]
MTYDELLARLEGIWHDSFKAPGYQALRAVVELHKPFDFKMGDENFTSCQGCGEADYPCPTIKAIEKELG